MSSGVNHFNALACLVFVMWSLWGLFRFLINGSIAYNVIWFLFGRDIVSCINLALIPVLLFDGISIECTGRAFLKDLKRLTSGILEESSIMSGYTMVTPVSCMSTSLCKNALSLLGRC